MIQTNTLVNHESGLNLDIEPNVIIRPNGIAKSSVSANSWQFSRNPTSNSLVIVSNDALDIKKILHSIIWLPLPAYSACKE